MKHNTINIYKSILMFLFETYNLIIIYTYNTLVKKYQSTDCKETITIEFFFCNKKFSQKWSQIIFVLLAIFHLVTVELFSHICHTEAKNVAQKSFLKWSRSKKNMQTKYKDKHFAIESCGHEKAIFKATDLRNDGRMPDSVKEKNWEGLLNTIKEKFHLATTSSFLLVKKDNIDDHVDNDEDFIDLWNVLIKDKKATSYTLKMVCVRCLEITKENKKMTWCPKDSNDPNFYGEMEQKNWNKYFEDLKQLIGGLSDEEHLEDENQANKIQTADDLKRIWADRYDQHNSNKWSLKLQVICLDLPKNSTMEPGVDGHIVTSKEKQELNDNEDETKYALDGPPQINPPFTPSTSFAKKQGEHFNIKLMLELVKKAEEAANTIQNQNVILLLGGTGAGKSTLIHFLAGSTMKEQIVDGVRHIAPVQIKNKALANVRTSAKAESETRYITAVPINLKGMNILVDIDSVVLCDTPGFEDTSGPEVDVANGIGVIRALQNCKSVKPVVLISYTALGNRMNCVKDLARTLVSIIPSIENHLSAFSYVFTKMPENERQYMNGHVKTAYDSIKDEQDKGFKSILVDIVKKTRKGLNAPNLLKDSPNNLLEELSDIKDFIKEPGEVFQPFVSENSKGVVHMQVQKHKEDIWLAYQNGDYHVAKIKLDELTDLNNILKLSTIESEYNDCVKKLTNEWNQKYEDAKSILNKRIASPHSISKDDMLAYQKVVNELVAANELRIHLKDAICGESLTQNINEQMKQLINAIEDEKEGESTLQVHLDKMAQVQACFPNFRNVYNEACQKLKKRVVDCVDEAKECIKKNEFLKFRKEVEKIGKVLILQEHFRSFVDIKEKIKDLENELLVHLDHIANEGRDVLKKTIKEERVDNIEENKEKEERKKVINVRIEKLDKNEGHILKTNVFLLEEAASTFELPCEYVGLDKSTKEIVRSFVNEIIEYFEKVGQEILNLFKKKRYQAFDEIKKLILVMEELRGMKVVKERTGSQYYQTIEKINAFVREVQKDIDVILGSLNRQNVSIDYNRLYECVLCVSNSKWINERQEDDSGSLIDTIKQKLISHLHELQQLSQELELDLDHPEHFKDVRNVFAHLEHLRCLEAIIPELIPFRQKVAGPLEQSVRVTLATIRREFALEAKNVTNQKKMRESLIQLKLCAEDIRATNLYLQKMEFKDAKDLDLKINATKTKIEELTKIMIMPDQQYKDNTKESQEILSQIGEIKQESENENSIPDLLPTSPQLTSDKEAVIHLKIASKWPTEGVEEKTEEGQQNSEKLKQEAKGMNESYQKQMNELKEKLDKDEQVKREYEKQLQKGEMSLASVRESLKSHEFVESDIQRLINNEKELNDKIRQCEREIAKLKKNSGYTFEVLNAPKTVKILQYLKECKAITFPADAITSQLLGTSGNDEDEKKQTENRRVVSLKQEITNTLNLVEEFLQKYSIFVKNQINSLTLIESGTTPSSDEKKDNNNDIDTNMIEEVGDVSNGLTEVKKLQKDYPTIFAYFPQDIIGQFDKRLKRMYVNLSDEMMGLTMEANSTLLKRKIAIAKAFSELDDFAQPNHKFHDLFSTYQNKIYSDEIEIKPALEAIKNRRYSTVGTKMYELEQIDDPNKKKAFKDIKTSWSRDLYTLAKKIKVLPLEESEVDIKNLKELKNNLEYIKEAHNASQFMNEMAKKKSLEQ
ncbi:hypothetical protein RFI_29278 [Reticulomyxa filosa]|uniref:Uncharacterized protein n=1 Tax=Reticulomyxa filosa TaxID=46433 RepID=X6M3R6_RETFI|nr:hypothetical protein RFI_29278 [Reticulomyxa filosa]|eukprot:ETO08112.1 hypothetical protein RFI_29278 [Reticulomyxa filosa]